MRPAERAWMALVAGIVAWEIACPEGEMLSHGFDRFLQRHPVATWTVTLITAAHLLNILPRRIDPYSFAFKYLEGRDA